MFAHWLFVSCALATVYVSASSLSIPFPHYMQYWFRNPDQPQSYVSGEDNAFYMKLIIFVSTGRGPETSSPAHPQVLEHKRQLICGQGYLLFSPAHTAMSRLRLDPYKYGGVPGMACLESCGVFEGMRRHHPVIMIGSSHQRSGIFDALPQIVVG